MRGTREVGIAGAVRGATGVVEAARGRNPEGTTSVVWHIDAEAVAATCCTVDSGTRDVASMVVAARGTVGGSMPGGAHSGELGKSLSMAAHGAVGPTGRRVSMGGTI
jgi:hypothetical protein